MEIMMLTYFCKSENRTEIDHLKKKNVILPEYALSK